jgi:thiol-disulfide isomerase/thioredoxin
MIYDALKILIFVVLTISVTAQSTIIFSDISLENAIKQSKAQNKNIFIDTYADWCIPCKRMDKVFRDEIVADLFNKQYINVRINMDYSPYADEYRKKFDIIFLPTMIILDKEGFEKYSIDKEMAAAELLKIAQICLDPSIYFESDATKIVDNPIGVNNGSKPANTAVKERILHRLGNNDNVSNPDFLYQEAYFRLELMDGSYKDIARKYLATQTDWSTDKNMRFIFDFVNNPDSRLFKYMIDNRAKFEKKFGKDQVLITTQIMVYNKLYQGVPRPNLDETIALFNLVDPSSSTKMAYDYYLARLYDECKEAEYIEKAKYYLNNINSFNKDIIYNLSELISHQEGVAKDDIDYCINLMEEKMKDYHHQASRFKLLATLYLNKNDKKNADKYIDEAIKLAKQKGLNLTSYLSIKQKII